MEQYVGLDVSAKATAVCVLGEDGAVSFEGEVATSAEAIAEEVRRRAPAAVRVGLESGPQSTPLWHGLRAAGLAAVCLDARHAAAVLAARPNKSDRNDARGLAELVRAGWYREVHVKGLESHAARALLAGRQLLVKQRVELDNQIRGLCRNLGLALGRGRGFTNRVAAMLEVHPDVSPVFGPLLAARQTIAKQIAAMNASVGRTVRQSPLCRTLMTAPGVGPLVALAFATAIDDPTRFKKADSVGAFLGLTPRRHQSGEVDHLGRISKCGDRLTRSLLYEAANVLLCRVSRPCALRRWGIRLARRAGWKKARVALARKLAVLLFAMWRDGTSFRWQAA